MSPKEFHGLCRAWNRIEERKDRRVATLQAFWVNTHSQQGARRYTADDFMGVCREPEPTPDDVMALELEAMFGCGPNSAAKEKTDGI
jgi:hypothetical protein